MRKNQRKQMRRLMAAGLALGMTAGAAFTSWAVSPTEATTPAFTVETKAIDSADKEQELDAEVWASVTNTPLKQLKVTLPIRLDFVIYQSESDGSKKLEFLSGDYTIDVDSKSEVGVKLDKIAVSAPSGSKWKLAAASAIATAADEKIVNLSMAGKELSTGVNEIPDFKVGIGQSESLGLQGTAAGGVTGDVTATSAERAFQVTYTISQDTSATPAS